MGIDGRAARRADLPVYVDDYTVHAIMASSRKVQSAGPPQGPGSEPSIASVGFVLIPGFALLTYASAVEPLRAANQLAGKALYRWWHAAPGDKPAVASNGAAVVPDYKFGSDTELPDLVMVCAGGNPATFNDKRTFAWLRKLAARGVIIGGVSGGPFILAKAGLLQGRRCTVHWEHVPALQEAFPDIELTRSLFEIDGDRITCSGGVAGLDMMVALITRDHGYELGAAVSDWFLHTHVRAGTGPQRMDLRFRVGVTDEKLLKALKAMETQIETPLSRQRVAKSAGVSLRQLERLFRVHLGRGLHEHYLALRLGRARQLLRESSLSILEVAVATGFASASQFSRAFRRAFDSPPRAARPKRRPAAS
jgi:transcriptional regulator GlxA family with amidase domain